MKKNDPLNSQTEKNRGHQSMFGEKKGWGAENRHNSPVIPIVTREDSPCGIHGVCKQGIFLIRKTLRAAIREV